MCASPAYKCLQAVKGYPGSLLSERPGEMVCMVKALKVGEKNEQFS